MEANPPHGEKSDFVRTTITLPPSVYELIAKEATRRKMSHEPNPVVSAIVREAVVAYLKEKR
jgi:transcriptional regulator of met regulon